MPEQKENSRECLKLCVCIHDRTSDYKNKLLHNYLYHRYYTSRSMLVYTYPSERKWLLFLGDTAVS